MWKNSLLFLITFPVMLLIAPFAYAACGTDYPNPIGFCDIPSFVMYLAGAVIKIAIPVSILLVVFVGFKIVAASAQGNVGKVTESRKMLTWILIGTALVVGAAAIVYGFVSFVRTV